MNDGVRNVRSALASFDEPWQPHRLTSVNDYDVKIAKIHGEFIWHSHPNTDELFFVIDGHLTLQLRDGDVELGPSDVYVVPLGVEHCPKAAEPTSIVMFELQGTMNTGSASSDRTQPLRELD